MKRWKSRRRRGLGASARPTRERTGVPYIEMSTVTQPVTEIMQHFEPCGEGDRRPASASARTTVRDAATGAPIPVRIQVVPTRGMRSALQAQHELTVLPDGGRRDYVVLKPNADVCMPHYAWNLELREPRRARKRGPLSSVCFRRKSDAVRKFADRNRDVIDAFGGLFNKGSKGEFDSINERYGLRGKRRVVNLQQAIARVLPTKAPYCLDKIDLETLNETAPARHAGNFRLPQEAEEQIAKRRYVEEYEQHYRDQFEGARRRRRRR